jgi:hypothetical protein
MGWKSPVIAIMVLDSFRSINPQMVAADEKRGHIGFKNTH